MKKTVAIVGASSDRSKFGNQSLRAHRDHGYTVFPVNLKGGEIEGLKVFTSILEIPGPVTRVSMYVSPSIGERLLPDIATVGCEELWLNPGSSSPSLLEKARSLKLHVIQGCSIVDLILNA